MCRSRSRRRRRRRRGGAEAAGRTRARRARGGGMRASAQSSLARHAARCGRASDRAEETHRAEEAHRADAASSVRRSADNRRVDVDMLAETLVTPRAPSCASPGVRIRPVLGSRLAARRVLRFETTKKRTGAWTTRAGALYPARTATKCARTRPAPPQRGSRDPSGGTHAMSAAMLAGAGAVVARRPANVSRSGNG